MTTPAEVEDPADLRVVQGLPLTRTYRFVGAAAVWPGAVGCEVRAQIRARSSYPVLLDLTPYLSAPAVVAAGEGVGTDIVVTLSMTGADTRLVTRGVYDLYLSDDGPQDVRAMRVARADGKAARVSVQRAITDGGV